MMCSAEVTGSLVPTVAKQIQSVDPETNKQTNKQIVRHVKRRAEGADNIKYCYYFLNCCLFKYKVLKLHKKTTTTKKKNKKGHKQTNRTN